MLCCFLFELKLFPAFLDLSSLYKPYLTGMRPIWLGNGAVCPWLNKVTQILGTRYFIIGVILSRRTTSKPTQIKPSISTLCNYQPQPLYYQYTFLNKLKINPEKKKTWFCILNNRILNKFTFITLTRSKYYLQKPGI